eukprot:jgi/Botrbrau1/12176/Bobra.0186s0084.1
MWKFLSGSACERNGLVETLNDMQGRQMWVFDPNAGTPEQLLEVDRLRSVYWENRNEQKNSADELLRLQCTKKRQSTNGKVPSVNTDLTDENVTAVIKHAVAFFEELQQEDGHWPGDYGGPMFLLPGMVTTLYVTGLLDTVLTPHHKEEMLRYLKNHQNPDGGFGLHIEGPSTMFCTGLCYATLRVLGMGPDDPVCQRAREWILARGGVTYITSWGKFWLAVLGVYSWKGLNPMPPELWLIPHSAWTGLGWVHPGRVWCHCRMVYLPMSYVYAKRFEPKMTKLMYELREELYTEPYSKIDWNSTRNLCAKEDLDYPHPIIQDMIWWTLYQAEPFLEGSWLRKKALEEAMAQIHFEDENTRYICIGPLNKAMNLLCCWIDNPDCIEVKKHIPRLYDYLWLAEDGMKMQGYNGSQCWDTCFAVQAITASGLGAQFKSCLKKALHFVDVTQVREDVPDRNRHYRHISKGAWPFSTRDHGWPISDCTSEGVKASLALRHLAAVVGPPIDDNRLFDGVHVMLSLQNATGGWATYELRRSFSFMELLNPSEVFNNIMIDYDYVECTSACMTALVDFRRDFPGHRSGQIDAALKRGLAYILSIQRPDGSWYGSWGNCFTYATWFGCEALAAMGLLAGENKAQDRACAFLLSKQNKEGGWSESYLSCKTKVYTESKNGESDVVQTAWAVLALISAGYHRIDRKPIDAGIRVLIKKQQPSGDFPQEGITGVFNKTCMITYANYRNIFPIWALGAYRSAVLVGVPKH